MRGTLSLGFARRSFGATLVPVAARRNSSSVRRDARGGMPGLIAAEQEMVASGNTLRMLKIS